MKFSRPRLTATRSTDEALRKTLLMVFMWRPKTLMLCLAVSMLDLVFENVMPTFTSEMIDTVPKAKRFADVEMIFWMLIIMSVSHKVLSLTRSYIETKMAAYLNININNFCLQTLLSKDMSFFTHPLTHPKSLPARIGADSSKIAYLVHSYMFSCVKTVFGLMVSLYMITSFLKVPWRLLAIGLLQPLATIPWTRVLGTFDEQMQVKLSTIGAKIAQKTQDLVSDPPLIKKMMAENETIRARRREQYESYDLQIERLHISIPVQAGMQTIGVIVSNIVLFNGILYVIDGTITYGQFVAFQSFLGAVQGRITGLFSLWRDYKQVIGVVRMMVDMLRTPVQMEKHERDQPYNTERPKFNDVGAAVGSALSSVISMVRDLRMRRDPGCSSAEKRNLLNKQRVQIGDPRLLPTTPPPPPWSAELRHVTFAYPEYGKDKDPSRYTLPRIHLPTPYVLIDKSIVIPAGKTTILFGENGTGKSSIASLLHGLYAADEGQVLVNGKDVRAWDTAELRNGIEVMAQKTDTVISGTILSNLFLGRGGDMSSEVLQDQQRRWVIDFARRTRFVMDMSMIDKPVVGGMLKTSGGESQRIALLRAAMMRHNMIILDEPTNNLDAECKVKGPAIHANTVVLGYVVACDKGFEKGSPLLCKAWINTWLGAIRKAQDAKDPTNGTYLYKPTVVIITHDESLQKFAHDDCIHQFEKFKLVPAEPPESSREVPEAHKWAVGDAVWACLVDMRNRTKAEWHKGEVVDVNDKIGAVKVRTNDIPEVPLPTRLPPGARPVLRLATSGVPSEQKAGVV